MAENADIYFVSSFRFSSTAIVSAMLAFSEALRARRQPAPGGVARPAAGGALASEVIVETRPRLPSGDTVSSWSWPSVDR